jgi:hypothetical protein
MFQFLVVMAALGQSGGMTTGYSCPPQPCVVYEQAYDVIEYRTGGESIQSKVVKQVAYNGDFYDVPVINGYAPVISTIRLWNGRKYTVYDYRRQISYEKCLHKDDGKAVVKPVPKPQPKVETIKPEIPKLELPKAELPKVAPVPLPPAPVPQTETVKEVVKKSLEELKKDAPKPKAPKKDLTFPTPVKTDTEEMMSPLPDEPKEVKDTNPESSRIETIRVIKPTYK